MGARVVATKHWSKGDQISSLIGQAYHSLTNLALQLDSCTFSHFLT